MIHVFSLFLLGLLSSWNLIYLIGIVQHSLELHDRNSSYCIYRLLVREPSLHPLRDRQRGEPVYSRQEVYASAEEHTPTAYKLTEHLRTEYGRTVVFPDVLMCPVF